MRINRVQKSFTAEHTSAFAQNKPVMKWLVRYGLPFWCQSSELPRPKPRNRRKPTPRSGRKSSDNPSPAIEELARVRTASIALAECADGGVRLVGPVGHRRFAMKKMSRRRWWTITGKEQSNSRNAAALAIAKAGDLT